MDTCIRKPLIATCSSDKSVRVWNYLENSSELIKYFPEEAFSVAIHPSGLYILVGFSDKLRLMNLLIDDIRSFREFTIRGCREVSNLYKPNHTDYSICTHSVVLVTEVSTLLLFTGTQFKFIPLGVSKILEI
jgi:WD40 repeat protein